MSTTIKIQVPVTAKTEEKEITLPYFGKSLPHFFKIIGDGYDNSLLVHDGTHSASIVTVSHTTALNCGWEEITEAEFVAAYQRVRARMDEKVFGVGEPA